MNHRLKSQEDVEIADIYLRDRFYEVAAKSGRKAISRLSADGLHTIGLEPREDFEDQPNIVALPGFCHGNWSYIKLIEELSKLSGVGFTAISPPGEAQSRNMQWENGSEKPVRLWRMADYEKAYAKYLNDHERKVILMGYSLGGLHALKLATADGVRDQIQGLIGINWVKPSNICHRNYVVQNKTEDRNNQAIFRPREAMDWITTALFNGEMPKGDDYTQWIIGRLIKTLGSNAVINDYAGEAGYVDPRKISVKLIEFLGKKDGETVAGVFNPNKVREALERFELFEINSDEIIDRRVKISDVLSGKVGDTDGIKGSSEIISVDIPKGTHASLLHGNHKGDKHVEVVAKGIADNYEWMLGATT